MMLRSRLKEVMEQKGMTIQQLATTTTLSAHTITALCRETVSGRTRLSTMERVADALGVSMCELIERLSDQPSNARRKGQ
jgi:transcriptional regulator with XRE-family HTH domain